MKHATHLPHSTQECMRIDSITSCVNEVHPAEIEDHKVMESKEEFSDECHFAVYQIADDRKYLDKLTTASGPEVELKPLPSHLKYEYLGIDKQFPVIVSSKLSKLETEAVVQLLRKYREVIGYSIADMKGISPELCNHIIFLEEGAKPTREHQRRLNPTLQEVVKKEILKLLKAEIIYPISDSEWVSPIHVVPKKSGLTVVET
jgi:hypothetical protein